MIMVEITMELQRHMCQSASYTDNSSRLLLLASILYYADEIIIEWNYAKSDTSATHWTPSSGLMMVLNVINWHWARLL